MSQAEPTLPWAPRPFDGEALGSWLGRLAAAYGMEVDEFAAQAGLSIDLGHVANWLALPPLSRCDGERLRVLCRLPAASLPAPYDAETPARLGYCPRCLYLNPVDVSAPYWQARWLLGIDSPWCSAHGLRHEYTSRHLVRGHRNMRRLLRAINRMHAARERAAKWKQRSLAAFMAR